MRNHNYEPLSLVLHCSEMFRQRRRILFQVFSKRQSSFSHCQNHLKGVSQLSHRGNMSLHTEQIAETNLWPRIQVVAKGDYRAIVAAQDIAENSEIAAFYGEFYEQPTAHTLQVDDNKHVLCLGGPVYTNHHCEPNAFLQFLPEDPYPRLVASRDILIGEEITFDYNSTEWEMATPFECNCNSKVCKGLIRGFKYLDRKTQMDLVVTARTSPFIRSKAAAEFGTTL